MNFSGSLSKFMILSYSFQLTKKAIIVYPNSGGVWDSKAKKWQVSLGSLPPFLSCTPSHSSIIFYALYLNQVCFPICFKRQLPKVFNDDDFGFNATRWRDLGAKIIGGCCRTTPSTIQILSNALREKS